MLLVCSPSNAEIYRWVDADGRVHFSDRPARDAERVDVRFSTSAGSNPTTTLGPGSPDEAYRGPYAELDILAPEIDATLTETDSGVPVSLRLDPALISGHRLLLLLDGSELTVEGAHTQFKLTGLGAGRHRLQLQIRGADDRIVAQSAPRTFELRQPRVPGQLP
ncbi:DUF4124 domain-containing protein [Allochromatium palmeri]|uniref:DUF4124 domain-containing protein n=1 Tax=Allochromatium palmeri TaxID=231048 RepID=UPI001642DAAF|nr:DUF4124 domain-containing protein [Allochromatium palmeri]